MLATITRTESEFPPRSAPHIVSEYFSVFEFAVLSSAGLEPVSKESKLKVLLSSACIAINNTSWYVQFKFRVVEGKLNDFCVVLYLVIFQYLFNFTTGVKTTFLESLNLQGYERHSKWLCFNHQTLPFPIIYLAYWICSSRKSDLIFLALLEYRRISFTKSILGPRK